MGRANPVELIIKKRNGGNHQPGEITQIVRDFMRGRLPDYQVSAWLMAAFLRGLDEQETWELTHAMLHSGQVLNLRSVQEPKVDKHSTGGVGDKISLCLGPLVAECGVAVPMISGRGLGHTGGTADKLEAISGYKTQLSAARFERIVREVGVSICTQTEHIAPADRRLYALRDVTGTVESVPLIVASILSKKLAEGIDGIVFDVKTGRGAFMKTERDAKQLATALVKVAKQSEKQASALLTDMSRPIGRTIGNALELREAVEVLNGRGPSDTRELTIELGIRMLLLAGVSRSAKSCRTKLERALQDGSAFERFLRMVRAHGGDTKLLEDGSRLPRAARKVPVRALRSGYVGSIDALELGWVAVALGAGRKRTEDIIDPRVGLELAVDIGERVTETQELCFLHASTQPAADLIERTQNAFNVTQRRKTPASRLIGFIGD